MSKLTELPNGMYWEDIRPTITELINQGRYIDYYVRADDIIASCKNYSLPIPPVGDSIGVPTTRNKAIEQLDSIDWLFTVGRYDKNDEVQKRVSAYWEQLKGNEWPQKALEAIGYLPFKSELPTQAGIHQARRRSLYSPIKAVSVWEYEGQLVCDLGNRPWVPLCEVSSDYMWRESTHIFS
jgi:hypothetical protein